MNKLTIIFIGLCLALLTAQTSCRNNGEAEAFNYITTEKLYDGCSVYQMIFKEGDYAFRFALSGRCSDLTKEMYISEYENFVEKYRNKIDLNGKKFIRIEYHDSLDIEEQDIKELIRMTELSSGVKYKLKEAWSEGFVMEAADNVQQFVYWRGK